MISIRAAFAATFTTTFTVTLFLGLLLMGENSMADSSTDNAALEPVLTEPGFEPAQLRDFWDQQVVDDNFFVSQHDGVKIHYAYVLHPEARAAIVISSGRTEAYIKYKEVVRDLYQQGYSVFIHDHRGQGLSDRLLTPEKNHVGYVSKFDHYADDLKEFVDTVVLAAGHQKHFLVAHSMGGAIVADYLQRHASDNIFSAAVMSSPMHGIAGEGWVARSVLTFLEWIGFAQNYIPFAGAPYDEVSAQTVQPDDCCTHSQPRKTFTYEEFAAAPAARLGGVSVHWVLESIRATIALRANAAATDVPLLIISGGADKVVNNAAQQEYCDNMNAGGLAPCTLETIPGALHEHFIETNDLRTQAMAKLSAFLEVHQ